MNKKLLIPGWAGALGDDEVKWIRKQLLTRPAVRRAWGITGYPTDAKIRRVASAGTS